MLLRSSEANLDTAKERNMLYEQASVLFALFISRPKASKKNKGNNKITELRTILQRENKTHKYINRQNQSNEMVG
jgi:hypothetical protein